MRLSTVMMATICVVATCALPALAQTSYTIQALMVDRASMDAGTNADGINMKTRLPEHTSALAQLAPNKASGYAACGRNGATATTSSNAYGTVGAYEYYPTYNFSAASTTTVADFFALSVSRTNLNIKANWTISGTDVLITAGTVEWGQNDLSGRTDAGCDAATFDSCFEAVTSGSNGPYACGTTLLDAWKKCGTDSPSCAVTNFLNWHSINDFYCVVGSATRTYLETTFCSDGATGVTAICDHAASAIAPIVAGASAVSVTVAAAVAVLAAMLF